MAMVISDRLPCHVQFDSVSQARALINTTSVFFDLKPSFKKAHTMDGPTQTPSKDLLKRTCPEWPGQSVNPQASTAKVDYKRHDRFWYDDRMVNLVVCLVPLATATRS